MNSIDKSMWDDQSGVSCVYKWTWSTVYLNTASTKSCFHNPSLPLTVDNFDSFHNLEQKILDRQDMLSGKWPDGCAYCKNAEAAGGKSDRQTANELPNIIPIEVLKDKHALSVSPRIVEIYFSNTCNCSCIYCGPSSSSKIQSEINKFGEFEHNSISIKQYVKNNDQYAEMLEKFWQWLNLNYQNIQRLNVLGGEPFLMPETFQLLEFFDTHPNPNLELNFVTNLNVPERIIDSTIVIWERLVNEKKLKRIDIVASLDTWGTAAEYIRNGLDLILWEKNFLKMLASPAVYLGINAAITNLSIQDMPALIKKWSEWNRTRPVGLYSVRVFKPAFLSPEVLPYRINQSAINEVLSLMPEETWLDKWCKERLAGAVEVMENSPEGNAELMKDLRVYLDELDRRRSTDWRKTFPWLQSTLDNLN
jgi:organic radical activating enzyme